MSCYATPTSQRHSAHSYKHVLYVVTRHWKYWVSCEKKVQWVIFFAIALIRGETYSARSIELLFQTPRYFIAPLAHRQKRKGLPLCMVVKQSLWPKPLRSVCVPMEWASGHDIEKD